MTLADFIGGLLEKRRKRFEERFKYQLENEKANNSFEEQSDNQSNYYGRIDDQLNDVLQVFGLDSSVPPGTQPSANSFNKKVDNDLDGKVTRSNIRSFFKRPNSDDNMNLMSNPNRSTFMKFGVSQSNRVIRHPDGTVEVETITKDGNGNVEKKVTYKKGDKVYSVVTKIDPSGVKKVEENVSTSDDVFPASPKNFWNSTDDLIPDVYGSDSGFDFWYDKFFRNEKKPSESFPANPFPFTNQFEQQIERMLKSFKPDSFVDSFNDKTWKPANKYADRDIDANAKAILDDFGKNESPFSDETKKFLETAENLQKSFDGQRQLNDPRKITRNMEKKMSKVFKDMFTAKKPTLFEAIEEQAKLDHDETPFDKYVELDEEKTEKMKTYWEQSRKYLDMLDQFLRNQTNKPQDGNRDNVVVSGNDGNIDLLLPAVTPESEINAKEIKKPIIGSFKGEYSKSETCFSDGKKRTEIIKNANDGTVEKVVTYVIGDKSFTVTTKTDPSGVQHSKKNYANMSDDDMKQFSNVWGNKFKSDFEE